MFRKSVNPSRDRRVFSHTADKTKVVNLAALNYRGGRRF